MPSISLLQRKQNELQQQYDLLSEKLVRLRAAYAIEAGAAARFQLEKQIEQAESERDAIEQQLDDLDRELEQQMAEEVSPSAYPKETTENAREKHRQLFAESQAAQCATIRTVARDRAPSIDSFYVTLRLGKRAIRLGMSAEDQEKEQTDPEHLAYARNLREWHESLRQVSEYELFELEVEQALEKPHVVILGDPGSGKSTLLQHLTWTYSKAYCDTENDKLLPILIRLPTLANCDNSLRQAVISRIEMLFPFSDRSTQERILEAVLEALQSRRALLLLDGLDEVPREKRIGLVEAVLSLTQSRVVVTSRYVGYHDELSTFDHFELAPLDEPSQRRLIGGWFEGDESTSQELVAALEANSRIRALGTNPLLLSIICFVFEQTHRLPRYRHELYAQATRQLLSIRSRPLAETGILESIKMDVLSNLCAEYFPPGYDEFDEVELYDSVASITQKRFPRIAPEELVLDLMHNSGLIYKRPDRKCLFLHLTFQEYFAAVGVASKSNPFAYLRSHLHDPMWREVILLTSGLLYEKGYRSGDCFVESILAAGSSFEHILHRDLLLAGRILSEDSPVDPRLRAKILGGIRHILGGKAYERLGSSTFGQTVFSTLGSMAGSDINDAALNMLLAYAHTLSEWSLTRPYGDALNRAIARFPESAEIREYVDTLSKPIESDYASTIRVGESRSWAVHALSIIGSGPCRGYVRLLFLGFLDSPEYPIRWAGASGLGRLGRFQLEREEFSKLVQCAQSGRSALVRTAAVKTLGNKSRKQWTTEVRAILLRAMLDRSAETKRAAIRAVVSWGNEPEVIERLVKLVSDESWRTRLAAAEGLAELGDDSYLHELLKSSHRTSPSHGPRQGAHREGVLSISKLDKQRNLEPILDNLGNWLFAEARSSRENRAAQLAAELVRESRNQELLDWLRDIAIARKHRLKRVATLALGFLGDSYASDALVEQIDRARLCDAIAQCLRASGRTTAIREAADRLHRKLKKQKAADKTVWPFLKALAALGPVGASEETVRFIEEEEESRTYGYDKNEMLVNLGPVASTDAVLRRLEDDWKKKPNTSALDTLAKLVEYKEQTTRLHPNDES